MALENIFKEHLNVATDFEPNLFKIAFDKINSGIDVAFPAIDYTSPELDFIFELKHNAAVFSAFKVHKLQNNIAAELIDEKGKLRSFSAFKKATTGLIKKDHRHLETEYNAAVIRARNAARWKEFERDQDLFPNLEWLPSTSVEKREYHKTFYGFIAPLDDPFWKLHYPGNLWGCKCGITNTADPATAMPDITAGMKPDPGLDTNPGITGELFTKTHPNFTNSIVPAKKLMPAAIKKSNAVILKKVVAVIAKLKNEMPLHNGVNFPENKNHKNLKTGKIKLLRSFIQDVQHHDHDPFVLLSVRNFEKQLDTWKYIGWRENYPFPEGHKLAGLKKHSEADYFMYYETTIHGRTMYANVKMHNQYKMETFYCYTDKLPEGIKKGVPKKQ